MNNRIEYYEILIMEILKQKNINFIMLGSLLHSIKVNKIYTQNKNYNNGKAMNFYKYIKDKFNLSKSIIVDYINVFLKFGTEELKIKKEYEFFTFTQLKEMLPMTNNDIKTITPQMSVMEIRKVKNKGLLTLKNSASTQNKIVVFENKVIKDLQSFLRTQNNKGTFNGVVNSAIKEYLQKRNFGNKKVVEEWTTEQYKIW